MISIYQRQTNTVTISSLEAKTSFVNPTYIFEFIDNLNYKVVKSFEDKSLYPQRYSTFIMTDSSDFTLRTSGQYNIYESLYDASIIDASMNLLENGQYQYFAEVLNDMAFDPSLFDYSNQDYVFDPLFATPGNTITEYISKDQLSANFQWIDGSLYVTGGGGGGVSQAYVDGSLAIRDLSINSIINKNTYQDVSINNIYPYIDGSLAIRDLSINSLFVKNTNQDASINSLDVSLNAIYGGTPITGIEDNVLILKNGAAYDSGLPYALILAGL